ncbi:hypothetical protein [Jiangella asiatica]|uniref:Uncharacterized protein n=1 Tax=Jiangella asiatica TaxID=2530372 RepID=A0A4R5CMA2_9ACTN|nr:hypothetical protein [Jiangella asiatica]TDE00407.1 hypothetical protein E1269_25545 [Jiangella asiatica]
MARSNLTATGPAVGGECIGPSGVAQSRGAPRVVSTSPQSHDLATAGRLCTASEELTGVRFLSR